VAHYATGALSQVRAKSHLSVVCYHPKVTL
jgi:hypothetical protein